MFSYSYQPQTMPFFCPSTPRPLEPRPVHVAEDRILGTIPDDLVTLDCLFGVASQGQECCFVQYKPTEKHKKCASLKVDPVQQINMFTQTLRDKSMPIDVCLQTHVPSLKKILWIRVSLAEVTELSLEPLWLIRGRVQLDRSKQRRATITIDDHSLEPCFLDPRSQLLCPHPERTPSKEFLSVAEEGVTGRDQGGRRESDEGDDDQRSNDGERDEHHEERDEIAFGVTRKRKVRNVKEDDATGVPPPHKKSKPPRGSHAVSLDPEPRELRDEEEDKRGCRTPPCVHKNFIRGTQTRMKSRRDVKRAMDTVYNMRSRRVRSDPVSRYQGDSGEHPLSPSHLTTSRGHWPQRATAAEDIPSHVQPSALTATAPDRESASTSWSPPGDSAIPFASAAVETPTTIPSEETSSTIPRKCSPLQSLPPEPQQNVVPQPKASPCKPPKGLGCSLM